MFDIGFLELMLVSIVGLLVLGPDRLPGAIRTVSLYVGKMRRSFNSIRAEVERELKADEIRQDLHNQAILQELRAAEKEVRKGLGVDDMKLGKDGYPLVDDPASDPAADTAKPQPAGTAAEPSTAETRGGGEQESPDEPPATPKPS